MKFNDVLRQVAHQLNFNPEQLLSYANEDTLAGCCDYPGMEGRSPLLIPYTYDGKFLYALVRALRPRWVLESGTLHGGSAAHIALALAANEQDYDFIGQLVTVDINPEADLVGVPEHLLQYIIQVRGENIIDWLGHYTGTFDFIHEDASHEVDTVQAVYAALPTVLTSGGVIVSHDTNSGARPHIVDGIQAAGFSYPPDYLYDESPCGFSVMRYVKETHNEPQ